MSPITPGGVLASGRDFNKLSTSKYPPGLSSNAAAFSAAGVLEDVRCVAARLIETWNIDCASSSVISRTLRLSPSDRPSDSSFEGVSIWGDMVENVVSWIQGDGRGASMLPNAVWEIFASSLWTSILIVSLMYTWKGHTRDWKVGRVRSDGRFKASFGWRGIPVITYEIRIINGRNF